MKQRFTIGDDGLFRDRHGNVLGRITSITLDLDATSAVGDIGGSSSSLENDTDPRDGGAGEGSSAPLLNVVMPPGTPAPAVAATVSHVWAHFVEVMQPRNKVAGPQERQVIREALKVATAIECCAAIDSCSASDYHMKRGAYATREGSRYNKLSQILRGRRGRETTRERIDFFLERADTNRARAGLPTSASGKIAVAKQRVLDGWQFPGDALVVSQGEEAAAWLVQLGIRIVRDPQTGRPTFEMPS